MGRGRAGGDARTISGAEVSETAGNPGSDGADAARIVSGIATTGADVSGSVKGTTGMDGAKATTGGGTASATTGGAANGLERRVGAAVRCDDLGRSSGGRGGDVARTAGL